GPVDVVVRDFEAVHEEGRDAGVTAESGLRADVVKNVVGDRIVRADAFHAGRVFLVATRVAQVHVLGVAHGDAAARDVGDIVPDDRRVDDVVDHRDPFAAAVLDGVA